MNETDKADEPEKTIGKFRTILPQVLASTAKNLLLLDLGMAVAFPTIVIPALRGLKAHDNNDILSLTDVQASWFAPIVTYVGEICQPSIRGVLTSCAGVAVMLGFSLVYFLGSITTWRLTALICCSVPITTAIAICFVPETPFWLMAKNRKEDAMKSLMWLRGWVSDPKIVEKEFKEIERYSSDSNRCVSCQKSDVKCNHKSASTIELLKELFRKRTLKPFSLVMTMFLFCQFSGLSAMRPYLVQIFQAFAVPIDASWATVVIGILGFAANIMCTIIIKPIGKRKIALISMLGTCVSISSLAVYAYIVLPPGLTSFDKHNFDSHNTLGYIPLTCIYALAFFTSLGLMPVPWMLLSEVFPFKTRSIATGITAALNYIMAFCTTKTYYNLETSLTLFGVVALYAAFDIVGLLYIYLFVPETERRTLEEIELHFSDNTKKLSDIKIRKNVNMNAEKEAKTNSNGFDNKGFENTPIDMGKTQSKRSVDISTEPTKEIQEGSGEVKKLDDAYFKENESSDKENKVVNDAVENEKNESAKIEDANAVSDEIVVSVVETTSETPKVDDDKQQTEETKDATPEPESATKPKKEKVKKKWSFRSLSFGRKDKQKPSKKDKKNEENKAVAEGTNDEVKSSEIAEEKPKEPETTVETKSLEPVIETVIAEVKEEVKVEASVPEPVPAVVELVKEKTPEPVIVAPIVETKVEEMPATPTTTPEEKIEEETTTLPTPKVDESPVVEIEEPPAIPSTPPPSQCSVFAETTMTSTQQVIVEESLPEPIAAAAVVEEVKEEEMKASNTEVVEMEIEIENVKEIDVEPVAEMIEKVLEQAVDHIEAEINERAEEDLPPPPSPQSVETPPASEIVVDDEVVTQNGVVGDHTTNEPIKLENGVHVNGDEVNESKPIIEELKKEDKVADKIGPDSPLAPEIISE
ncbi:CLUMA_CG010709, isoform A [Clunio marinus]|uniref:CLUMA_CG010709, isoform A n=1 Tax=Clunio marinus TaxID=568069 RepID=A0A1J1IAS6_9DIPT|nr:CLUMA_CG010709, isoform A [Clunio marinus]